MAKLKAYHILIASLTAALSANAATIDCSNIDSDAQDILQSTYNDITGTIDSSGITYAELARYSVADACPTYDCGDSTNTELVCDNPNCCNGDCTPAQAQLDGNNCKCYDIDKASLASSLCYLNNIYMDSPADEDDKNARQNACASLLQGYSTCASDDDDIITSCASNEYYGSGGCTPCPTFAYNNKQYDYVVAPAYDGTNIQTAEDCYVPESSYYVEGSDERGTYRQNLLELDGKDGIACTLGEQ